MTRRCKRSVKNYEFNDVFDCVDIPVFIHGKDFRLIYANQAYLSIANTDESEALGKLYWEVFPKQETPPESCYAATLSKSAKSSRDELSVKDRVYLSMGFIKRDDGGDVVFAIQSIHDITEQKRVMHLLQSAAEQETALFELSPDAIMMLDEHGFTDCNPATLRIFGCGSKEQFVGYHPSHFSPAKQPNGEDSFNLANSKIKQALKNGNNAFEWRHSRLDGSEFDAEVLLVAFTQDGRLILQATVRDISQRKEAERKVESTVEKLNLALEGIVRAVSKTMGFRDQYTTLHQKRVADISCAIAERLGWPEERIKGLKLAALIHDIGKISTPTDILTKPAKLSHAELELVREHAEIGYQILKEFEFPWDIAEMVRQHHERLDGSGYPQGLKGDAILPEAKIIAVADTIESMAAHRPYRLSMGLSGALNEVRTGSGKLYDAEIVNAALALFDGETSLEDSEVIGSSEV